MNKVKLLITGGAGFIGSEFVRQAAKRGYKPIVVDKLTYAGDLKRLETVSGKYKFYKTDIIDSRRIEAIFAKESPKAIVHFAAETHVDRSINCASPFIKTNILGTQVLLDAARKFKIKRFIHISTDEVYGDIEKGKFFENSPLKPSSPYAASKAAADLIIKSYMRTYNFPAIIIRPSNNYGPWQYPEKLLPVTIQNILRDKLTPVYAKGQNVREWLFVSDCVDAIFSVLEKGRPLEIYNLGSGRELKNIEVVKHIIKLLGKSENLIKFVKDRPGHDIRYFLDSGKILRETGWRPKIKFEDGLSATINWCVVHKSWLLKKCFGK